MVSTLPDDYHRYDRSQHAITPLHPDCNPMDIMAQHLAAAAANRDGRLPSRRRRLEPPAYPAQRVLIVEGLLGYLSEQLRGCFDIRVYLDPPEPAPEVEGAA